MPTAEDFRLGIADIDREVQTISATQRLCDRHVDDFGFTGGVSDVVRDSLVAGSGNAAKIGSLVTAVRDEMDRKARLCDQYTVDMRAYRRDHRGWALDRRTYLDTPIGLRADLWPGREPQPPPPPFTGSEVSP